MLWSLSTAKPQPAFSSFSISFFFQAEDGIRDPLVTGVQTCALPIFWHCMKSAATTELAKRVFRDENSRFLASRRLSSDAITRTPERCAPKFPLVPWWCCVMAVLILSPGCSKLFPTSTSGTGAPQLGQTLSPIQAAILAARLANDECERRHK